MEDQSRLHQGEAFILLLERGARFLNLEIDWNILHLRHTGSKDGIRESGRQGRRLGNSHDSTWWCKSEEWGGGSEETVSQGSRTDLVWSVEGRPQRALREWLGLVALCRMAQQREHPEEGHTAKKQFWWTKPVLISLDLGRWCGGWGRGTGLLTGGMALGDLVYL